jgi:hypothetical protein
MIHPAFIQWYQAVTTGQNLPATVTALPATLDIPADILLWLTLHTYQQWPECPNILSDRASAPQVAQWVDMGAGLIPHLPDMLPSVRVRVLQELAHLLPAPTLEQGAELAMALQSCGAQAPELWRQVVQRGLQVAERQDVLTAAEWCLRGGQAESAAILLKRWRRKLPRRPEERKWALEDGVRAIGYLPLYKPDPLTVRRPLNLWVESLWSEIRALPEEQLFIPFDLLAEAFRWDLPCAHVLLEACPEEVPVTDATVKLLALLLSDRWSYSAWQLGEFLDYHAHFWTGLTPQVVSQMPYDFPFDIPESGAERPLWLGWGLMKAMAKHDRLPQPEEYEVLLDVFFAEKLAAARTEAQTLMVEAQAALADPTSAMGGIAYLLEEIAFVLEPLARLDRWLSDTRFPWIDWVNAYADAVTRGIQDSELTAAFFQAFAGIYTRPLPAQQHLALAQAEAYLQAACGQDPTPALAKALAQFPELNDEIAQLGAFSGLALLGSKKVFTPYRNSLFAQLAALIPTFDEQWHSDLWAALTHTRVRAQEIPQAIALLAHQPSAEARLGVLSRFSSVLSEIKDTTLYPEVLNALAELIPEVPAYADKIRWQLAFAYGLKGMPDRGLAALSL